MSSTPLPSAQYLVTAPGRVNLLGEHTEEVLAQLGYSQQQIAELREAKVI